MAKRDQAARNRERARKLQERIALQLKRGAGKGVEAAVRFLAARIKETVSVPAPKVAVRGTPVPGKKLGPILSYRATTKAVKGAPPRVLSGRLRQGVTHKMVSPIKGLVGVHARAVPTRNYPSAAPAAQASATGFNYPKHHEVGSTGELGAGDHPYIKPTVDKYRRELRTLVGVEVKTELKLGGW